MTKSSLTKKIINGGFWMFSLRIVCQVFIFTRVTVLARILSPGDFGLVGVALLAMYMLYTLAQTGAGQALVHKKESIEDYFDTVWVISICRGFFLFSLMFFGAPLVADFFDNRQIISVLRALAFSPLILGFNSPKTIYVQKEFQFNKQFISEISALAVELLVSIIFAYVLRNFWAIVLGFLAGNITRFILSYTIFPYKPHFQLDINKANSLLHFGKWVFASGVIGYTVSNGDNIFVGKVLGVAALGLYQVAFRFSDILASELTYTAGQVLFPAYSKLHSNKQSIAEAFSKTIELIALFSIPIAAGMFVLAPDFITIVLGEKWIAMVPVFKILIISGLIRSFTATGGALFMGSGNPKIDFKTNLFRLAVMGITIYPLTKLFGINGVAISVVSSVFASAFIWYRESVKIARIELRMVFNIMMIPAACTAIMVLFIFLTKNLFNQHGLLQLIIVGIVAICVYIICLYMFWYKNRNSLIYAIIKQATSS